MKRSSNAIARPLAAEALGTLFLVATVVGSGIMAETLSGGNAGLALLGNTLATGAILIVIILIFGGISGAHFNPAVTLAFALRRDIAPRLAILYMITQIAAGIAGTGLAHLMFEQPILQTSLHTRTGVGQWVAESVATFGLLATIFGCLRFREQAVPYAVGLFIMAGYWFTSSTSFANPAVAIARSFTNSFSGIAPTDVPPFIAAELIGAVLAVWVMGWLLDGAAGEA